MKYYTSRNKNKAMQDFSAREWAIADKNHFTNKLSWNEINRYIRIVANGKILGMLHYSLKAGVMEIITLIVDHTNQQQGIGSLLLRKAEAVARKNKVHKIFLYTGKDWDALKFYGKSGFKITGELTNHHQKRDWLILTKLIG